MNQIAGVDVFNIMNNLRLIIDEFSIMNNLRLVIIVAIFIVIIIVLLLNRILRPRRRAKRKYMQAVNPYGDSSREEQHAPGAVDDFPSMEEYMKEEKSKGGESTDESEVEIEGQPVVNYENIEADLKAVRDEITTKIKVLILKIEAVEKAVLNKIEDVIGVKIQEVSNNINESLIEVLRTQKNLITSVSEQRADFLRKEEVPADILTSEDTVMSGEIKEKKQTDTIVPSGEIEEKISEGYVGESVGFEEKKERDLETPDEDKDILEKLVSSLQMRERSTGTSSSGESKVADEENVPPEEIKENELEIPPEAKEEIKAEEEEQTEAIASSGEVEENIPEGGAGESDDFDIKKLLEEEPVGMSSTEESREVEEKEPIEANTSTGEVEEKIQETDKDSETKGKEQIAEIGTDFDIQDFLEELGSLPSEKDLESEK